MDEIIYHIQHILKTYNISLHKLTAFADYEHFTGKTDSEKLRHLILQKFHEEITEADARELDILLLTYHYINQSDMPIPNSKTKEAPTMKVSLGDLPVYSSLIKMD